MMLFTAADPAPNPRRVHLFLAIKGIEIPRTDLSLTRREHKSAETLARNSRGQVPFLVLDDGNVLAESISICRYLDELPLGTAPQTSLFGSSPFERAETDMWIRRIESALGLPIGLFWQHGHPLTASLVDQIPAMAEQARQRVLDAMAWLDSELTETGWLIPERLTMADITLITSLDFAEWIGLSIPSSFTKLLAWHSRATERLVTRPKLS